GGSYRGAGVRGGAPGARRPWPPARELFRTHPDGILTFAPMRAATILALLLPIAACASGRPTESTVSSDPVRDGWTLVWSDEFEDEGLPDPERWTYEEGFVRNQELQYYTRGRMENARVEGGHLVIEARREPYE